MTPAPASHLHAGDGGAFLDALLIGVAAGAVVIYLVAAVVSRRRGRPWPVLRGLAWTAGVLLALGSVAGPLATAAHGDFAAHMRTHLLAGMLAPVLLVLGAPVTLALRTLPIVPARRLSAALRCAPVRILTGPVITGVLSAGGLWLLYLSPLYAWIDRDPLAHVLVHGHLLVTGYLFTAAVIGRDPSPHPSSRLRGSIVLLAVIASHAVLAKHLYGHAPLGVPVGDAQEGARFMYYAGATVEALVVVLFCADWYRAAGRRLSRARQAVSTSSAKNRAADPEKTGLLGEDSSSTTSQTTAVTLSRVPARIANATISDAASRGLAAPRSRAATSASGT
jgi:putative membrane protein